MPSSLFLVTDLMRHPPSLHQHRIPSINLLPNTPSRSGSVPYPRALSSGMPNLMGSGGVMPLSAHLPPGSMSQPPAPSQQLQKEVATTNLDVMPRPHPHLVRNQLLCWKVVDHRLLPCFSYRMSLPTYARSTLSKWCAIAFQCVSTSAIQSRLTGGSHPTITTSGCPGLVSFSVLP